MTILGHGNEAETPTLDYRDQERPHRRVEVNHTLIVLPLSRADTVPHHRIGSLLPMVSPVEKKREREIPRQISSSPRIVGHFLGYPIWSCLLGITGESVQFDHWESDCDGGGGRTCSNQCSDLGRLSSYSH